jgi:hypothetical protein
MNRGANTACSLYLGLRALRLEVRLHDDPRGTGGVLDYGIALGRLHLVSVAQVSSVTRRVLENENDLVRFSRLRRIRISARFAGKATVANGGAAVCVSNSIKRI